MDLQINQKMLKFFQDWCAQRLYIAFSLRCGYVSKSPLEWVHRPGLRFGGHPIDSAHCRSAVVPLLCDGLREPGRPTKGPAGFFLYILCDFLHLVLISAGPEFWAFCIFSINILPLPLLHRPLFTDSPYLVGSDLYLVGGLGWREKVDCWVAFIK